MIQIRKYDIVTLLDGNQGEVLEIITTEIATVYKVKKLRDNDITYFDENKVRLQKCCARSSFVNIIKQGIHYLLK